MALQTWLIYLAAVIGLSLTPGPNGLLALTHGALYGHRRTLYTVLGGISGFTVLMALSMAGIGTLLQSSADALTVLRWVGGAYLVWLGIQLWRSPPLHLTPIGNVATRPGHHLFRQGLFSALSNPKVLLFFGAFLPQFIDPQRPLMVQFVIMALTFAVTEGFVEYLLARLAYRIRPWLERSGRGFNRCCGGLFMAVGAILPVSR